LVYENEIAITWTLGIGISAIIASYLLISEKTKHWDDKKIAIFSTLIAFSLILLLGSILKVR